MASHSSTTGFKKRRLQGACDLCRTKKIRCDSAKMPGNICSNCRAFGSECTHLMSAPKKKDKDAPGTHSDSPPTALPVNFDNAKIQIADILSTSAPYQLPTDPVLVTRTLTEIASYARALENELKNQNHSSLYPLGSTPARLEQIYPDIELEVSDSIKRLELLGLKETFLGEESQLALLKEAMSVRNEYTSEQKPGAELKRSQFWDVYPWQKLHDPRDNVPSLVFPDPDLLYQLVDFYFRKRNGMVLLHRPTFEQALRDGLHKRDRDFGELVLSVCGLGAWYTDDPRAFADRTDSKYSLGWRYYEQIVLLQDLSRTTALYRVQIIINAIMFLQPSSKPSLCWPLLGLGVRFAQIVGAHRRGFYGPKPNPTTELWKRAFWCLVCIDTYMSAFTGRPRATNPADYDLEFPEAVDDEFWLNPDPEQAFKQPVGKPASILCWIHSLKLLDIFGVAQRSILAAKRPQRWTSDTSGAMLSELDAALNTWVDTIPDHLKWDPHREDSLFFHQSCTLYSDFYWVQIQIHRGGLKHSGMSYSSLAVTANAARSCVSVLARLHARGGDNALPTTIVALSNSCIILLLNLWSAKKLGLKADPIRDMGSINKCLDMLKLYEPRWQNAGRMRDIISELISASNTDIPTELPRFTSLKRHRENEGADGAPPPDSTTVNFPSNATATSTSEPCSTEFTSLDRFGLPPSLPSVSHFDWNLFAHGLPLHAEDLGRLPVHSMTGVESRGFDTQGAQLFGQYSDLNSDSIAPYLQHSAHDGDNFGLTNLMAEMGAENPTDMQTQAALAMFHDTPGGDQWDDWGTYLTTVDEILQALNPCQINT